MWSVPPFWGCEVGDAMVLFQFAGACETLNHLKMTRRCSSGAKSFRCQAALERRTDTYIPRGTITIQASLPHSNKGIVTLGMFESSGNGSVGIVNLSEVGIMVSICIVAS